MAITSKQRKEVELLIYKVMDILDPTEQNKTWYMNKFKGMTNDQFYEYFKQEFPLKFQMRAFEIEPKMDQITKALDTIHVPLMENYICHSYTQTIKADQLKLTTMLWLSMFL